MNCFIAIGNDLGWRINDKDKKYIPLKSFPNLQLVNPSYYHGENIDKNFIKFSFKIASEVILQSNVLIFKYNKEDVNNEEIYEFCTKFIRKLKLLSKQPGINPIGHVQAVITKQISKFGKLNVDLIDPKQINYRKSKYYSYITIDKIKEADKLIKNKITLPIYLEILLDAFDGFYFQDYRKTILYSAFAVETMINYVLNDKYQKYLLNNPNSTKLRISTVQIKDELVVKDPIYEKLDKLNSFNILLHEKPLYILGKSLLLDDHDLYTKALQLNQTRNNLVHRGEVSTGNKNALNLNYDDDAFEAIRIANKVFNWFGVKEFNNIITQDFIKIEDDI